MPIKVLKTIANVAY